MSTDDWQPPTFHPACALCIRRFRHEHPGGLRPVWPCWPCHDGLHERCRPEDFCSCDCGLKGNP